jgi:hypothetical protein
MRTGVRWNYDVDEYTIIDVSDYGTHSRRNIASDTATWIRSIEISREHGGPFQVLLSCYGTPHAPGRRAHRSLRITALNFAPRGAAAKVFATSQ